MRNGSNGGEKKCYCTGYTSQGDISPRLWKCPKHGKTGFAISMYAVRCIAEQYEITENEAWNWAKAFLEWKQVEALKSEDVTVYYCEDHFIDDLQEEFDLGAPTPWYVKLYNFLTFK